MSNGTSLTREDWIQAACRKLIKESIDTVRVDVLAKELNITRGSFYYHFKSRQELLESLLTHWRVQATENIIHQLGNPSYSPEQRLEHLLNLPFHGQTASEAADLELAIRAWARRNESAQQVIEEVDSLRLKYIESLLRQVGYDSQSAGDVAVVIYAYLLNLGNVLPKLKAARLEKHLRIIKQWLTPSM